MEELGDNDQWKKIHPSNRNKHHKPDWVYSKRSQKIQEDDIVLIVPYEYMGEINSCLKAMYPDKSFDCIWRSLTPGCSRPFVVDFWTGKLDSRIWFHDPVKYAEEHLHVDTSDDE